MTDPETRYRGYRFPPEIISHAVWLHHRLVADKLRSYAAAHRRTIPSVRHCTTQYANNRAEVSHQATRLRERLMRRFKPPGHAQRFLAVHGAVLNLFRVGRHLLRAISHR